MSALTHLSSRIHSSLNVNTCETNRITFIFTRLMLTHTHCVGLKTKCVWVCVVCDFCWLHPRQLPPNKSSGAAVRNPRVPATNRQYRSKTRPTLNTSAKASRRSKCQTAHGRWHFIVDNKMSWCGKGGGEYSQAAPRTMEWKGSDKRQDILKSQPPSPTSLLHLAAVELSVTHQHHETQPRTQRKLFVNPLLKFKACTATWDLGSCGCAAVSEWVSTINVKLSVSDLASLCVNDFSRNTDGWQWGEVVHKLIFTWNSDQSLSRRWSQRVEDWSGVQV